MTTTFESPVRQIAHPQELVYATLSDLSQLERLQDKIPKDKIENLAFDADHLAVKVPMAGNIRLHIVDREPPKTVKFETEESPVPFNFWIQLVPVTAGTCKIKLTIRADLNPFIGGMVKKPLQEVLEKLVDVMANIPYA